MISNSRLMRAVMTTQIFIRFPTELARRFRNAVPARQRSAFVFNLLEQNLPNADEYMYELALKAEAFDRANAEEPNELESTLMDGVDRSETFDTDKLFALCQK
jgi:DNA-directed RNA polymerase beta' subunit